MIMPNDKVDFIGLSCIMDGFKLQINNAINQRSIDFQNLINESLININKNIQSESFKQELLKKAEEEFNKQLNEYIKSFVKSVLYFYMDSQGGRELLKELSEEILSKDNTREIIKTSISKEINSEICSENSKISEIFQRIFLDKFVLRNSEISFTIKKLL